MIIPMSLLEAGDNDQRWRKARSFRVTVPRKSNRIACASRIQQPPLAGTVTVLPFTATTKCEA